LSEPTTTLRLEALKAPDEPPPSELPRKRKRFSADTANDLLFWGVHFCLVAISLAIVWSKIDGLQRAVTKLLVAQSQELDVVQKQLLLAQAQTESARQAEHTRALQFDAANRVLGDVVSNVTKIQADVRSTLTQIQSINQSMLKVTSQSANAASEAANAAQSAANSSASTHSLVARKVVTTADKEALDAQRAALAAKQKQLQRVIRTTKIKGPTIFQKIFQ
jgi:chromosome segregation ATPase